MDGKQHKIFANQLGYKMQCSKYFSATVSGHFEVVNAINHHVVYTGSTSQLTRDEVSGIYLARGDFSPVEREGVYYIRIKNTAITSHSFVISDYPYEAVKRSLLKNFYYQRCGVALDRDHAGIWAREDVCHLSHARIYGTNETMATQGGWHDAGDYGKYIVPAAKAIADLLLAYEWFPEAFEEEIGIPNETGMPDILVEAKVGLDFMLKMQREDGAVYHKVTTAEFPSLDCMPQDDDGELIVSPVSNTATGTFAACMALASRFYGEFDEPYAAQCVAAAEKAWHWLTTTPNSGGFRNPPDIRTGEYGDDNWQDEIYWAAAELYKITRQQQYLDVLQSQLADPQFSLCEFGWADTGGYGTLCLLTLTDDTTAGAIARAMNVARASDGMCVEESGDGGGDVNANGDMGAVLGPEEVASPRVTSADDAASTGDAKLIAGSTANDAVNDTANDETGPHLKADANDKSDPFLEITASSDVNDATSSKEDGDPFPDHLLEQLRNAWKEEADRYVTQCEQDGFGISLLAEDYVWGSNMVVMNRAMLLVTAAAIFQNTKYLVAAKSHWHYLLGHNVLGYCFVTGFGVQPVLHPHHRPSVADNINDPVPGMVAGGPNRRVQDEVAAQVLKGQPPAACFIDHLDSYSTNEVTIYWNSPAVFVAAFANSH